MMVQRTMLTLEKAMGSGGLEEALHSQDDPAAWT